MRDKKKFSRKMRAYIRQLSKIALCEFDRATFQQMSSKSQHRVFRDIKYVSHMCD